jgi:pSer/pThr/pTyr-binding forkhead associated (FHA) protein
MPTDTIKRMARVTFQVIDGVDKGRIFRDLATPVTLGREEGNSLRLNDERVSRFHAKVQQDNDDVILTDLDSTNGTRVNSSLVQIHRLRHGDFVTIGRTTLLFGSYEEIAARQASLMETGRGQLDDDENAAPPTLTRTALKGSMEGGASDADLTFGLHDPVKITRTGMMIGGKEFPPLPLSLTPSQSARLAEIFDFLHRALIQTTEQVQPSSDGSQITVDYATWQKFLAVSMLLARYHRAVTDPESWEQ